MLFQSQKRLKLCTFYCFLDYSTTIVAVVIVTDFPSVLETNLIDVNSVVDSKVIVAESFTVQLASFLSRPEVAVIALPITLPFASKNSIFKYAEAFVEPVVNPVNDNVAFLAATVFNTKLSSPAIL